MTSTNAKCWQTADELFERWRHGVLSGELPRTYETGTGELRDIGLAPGQVLLIGGAPAAGKTAFTMQVVVDALRLDTTLRATVCNVEMSPQVLLDRQLARLSGIDLSVVRSRQFGNEHADRLDSAISTIENFGERLNFVSNPYTLENCAKAVDEHQSDVLVLDYAQRIRAPGQHGDRRGAVDALMDYIRQFCETGIAVIVVSAVGRGRDSSGKSSYAAGALSLASFRESSELEYGADDAYIIAPEEEDDCETIIAKHLKARHREQHDIKLTFDRPRQSFSVAAIGSEWSPNGTERNALEKEGRSRGKRSQALKSTKPSILAGLQRLWNETAPATRDEGGDE